MKNIELYNNELEKNILSLCLLGNNKEILKEVIYNYKIDTNHFHNKINQKIFKNIKTEYLNNKNIDLITIIDTFNNETNVQKYKEYCFELCDRVVMPHMLENYINNIIKYKSKRDYKKILDEHYEKLKDFDNTEDIKIKLIQDIDKNKINNSTNLKDLSQIKKETMKFLNDIAKGNIKYIQTGYKDLDDTLKLVQGNLVIIGARPSVGKSALAINFYKNLIDNNHKGIYFSIEMTSLELSLRIKSAVLGIDSAKFKEPTKLTVEEWYDIDNFNMKLKRLDIYDDSFIDIKTIEQEIYKYKTLNDEIDFIIIDYIQIMGELDNDFANERSQLSYITRSLKKIAKKYGIVIFGLAQVNRNVEARQDKFPMLSDIKGSGTFEADADVVLLLHRPELYNIEDNTLKDIMELLIAKNRNGITNKKLRLNYNKKCFRIEDLNQELIYNLNNREIEDINKIFE